MNPSETIEFLARPKYKEIESRLADLIGLKIIPSCTQTRNLLRQEISSSCFTAEDIDRALAKSESTILSFAETFQKEVTDFGEEYDPQEGNQQDDDEVKVLGFSEGFLVAHVIDFLYVTERPDDLKDYYKKKRIPHAAKSAKETLSIFTKSIEQK